MSPFFTRVGDDGTTGLLGDKRVDKSDLQIEVLGSLDELSAAMGLARSLSDQWVNEDLKNIQIDIYKMMSEVAATSENADQFRYHNEESVNHLENLIEKYSTKTQLPDGFILPGDNPASGAISMARTIARRAERRLVELSKKKPEIRKVLLQYLNRLSSFLFILEVYSIQHQSEKKISLAKKKTK